MHSFKKGHTKHCCDTIKTPHMHINERNVTLYFSFFIYYYCYYFVDRQLNVVMPGSHIPEHVRKTYVYHLPAPTKNKLKTYMKYQYECDKQTSRQSVTSSNVSHHILKGSVPRFCKKQKNANFKVNFNRIYTQILKSVTLTCEVCSSIQMMPITLFKSINYRSQT